MQDTTEFSDVDQPVGKIPIGLIQFEPNSFTTVNRRNALHFRDQSFKEPRSCKNTFTLLFKTSPDGTNFTPEHLVGPALLERINNPEELHGFTTAIARDIVAAANGTLAEQVLGTWTAIIEKMLCKFQWGSNMVKAHFAKANLRESLQDDAEAAGISGLDVILDVEGVRSQVSGHVLSDKALIALYRSNLKQRMSGAEEISDTLLGAAAICARVLVKDKDLLMVIHGLDDAHGKLNPLLQVLKLETLAKAVQELKSVKDPLSLCEPVMLLTLSLDLYSVGFLDIGDFALRSLQGRGPGQQGKGTWHRIKFKLNLRTHLLRVTLADSKHCCTM